MQNIDKNHTECETLMLVMYILYTYVYVSHIWRCVHECKRSICYIIYIYNVHYRDVCAKILSKD